MSETYADLGGAAPPRGECESGRRHRYDPTSGYCGACGRRDDGKIVAGTPAARSVRAA